jgi:hypothetical protein
MDDEEFYQFVNAEMEFDGNISECDISDDEDDEVGDPNYSIPNNIPNTCDLDSDDEDVTNSSQSIQEETLSVQNPTQEPMDSNQPRRIFWLKKDTFSPLPVPGYQEFESPGVVLRPLDYFSTYIPEDMFELLSTYTNQNYLLKSGDYAPI